MIIVMLVLGWLAVAGAMLWGVLRISRRHHPHPQSSAVPPAGLNIGKSKSVPLH
jgi:hypothetical protein